MTDMTTIKVRRSTRARVSELAGERGVTQSELLDQLLDHEAEREFWVGLSRLTPEAYRAALAEDDDHVDMGFGLEDSPTR
ncbi:hypothetical protein [Demequina silvatica]|uniref:hypothetical protein n=1 Tax=Demequina silvatica TaxID=1638988 RepID=UPI0007807234|nr:hypothetical protein [Demequina silvatica]